MEDCIFMYSHFLKTKIKIKIGDVLILQYDVFNTLMRDSFDWNYRPAVSLDRVPGEQVHILHFTSDVVQLSL